MLGRSALRLYEHPSAMPRHSAKKVVEDEDRNRKRASTNPCKGDEASCLLRTAYLAGCAAFCIQRDEPQSHERLPIMVLSIMVLWIYSAVVFRSAGPKCCKSFVRATGNLYCIRGDYEPSSHCKAAQAHKGSLGQVAPLPCSAECRIVRQARAGSLGSSGSC